VRITAIKPSWILHVHGVKVGRFHTLTDLVWDF